jgi:hypothetical protein
VHAVLRTAELETRESPRWREDRPILTTLASGTARLGRGSHPLALVPRAGARRLPRGREILATLTVTAQTASGERLVAARVVRIAR